MKKDISTNNDIILLVNTFYEKVKTDNIIGYIFTEVAHVNWENHLPILYKFWENTLFYTGSYEGNPMELHKHLHRLMPLTTEHFNQWTTLFNTTVDELFSGETAELAKQRSSSIASVMQAKINELQKQADKIY
ncbi:MAG: group III truncated hemoglobin [Chitinophagaceae bacterium]|nr:group III truncated hemoglobin [Chitinophagaceae bacterium]